MTHGKRENYKTPTAIFFCEFTPRGAMGAGLPGASQLAVLFFDLDQETLRNNIQTAEADLRRSYLLKGAKVLARDFGEISIYGASTANQQSQLVGIEKGSSDMATLSTFDLADLVKELERDVEAGDSSNTNVWVEVGGRLESCRCEEREADGVKELVIIPLCRPLS